MQARAAHGQEAKRSAPPSTSAHEQRVQASARVREGALACLMQQHVAEGEKKLREYQAAQQLEQETRGTRPGEDRGPQADITAQALA